MVAVIFLGCAGPPEDSQLGLALKQVRDRL